MKQSNGYFLSIRLSNEDIETEDIVTEDIEIKKIKTEKIKTVPADYKTGTMP
jgi:hypothetical protein